MTMYDLNDYRRKKHKPPLSEAVLPVKFIFEFEEVNCEAEFKLTFRVQTDRTYVSSIKLEWDKFVEANGDLLRQPMYLKSLKYFCGDKEFPGSGTGFTGANVLVPDSGMVINFAIRIKEVELHEFISKVSPSGLD